MLKVPRKAAPGKLFLREHSEIVEKVTISKFFMFVTCIIVLLITVKKYLFQQSWTFLNAKAIPHYMVSFFLPEVKSEK